MRNKHLFLLLLAAFFAPLAMNAQNTLTVHDGTETSERVPIFSWHANVDQKSQLIYPASELADMSGKVLTQMVFYWQQGQYGDDYSVGTWTISLGETTATAFNDGFDTTTPLTEVFTGVLDEAGGLFNTTDHTLTIAFDEEYAYQGGNLLVQFAHTGTGEDMDYRFIGQSMDEATSYLCCYESDGTAYNDGPNNFLPKTTFTYQAQPNCAKPTNLAVSYTEGDPTATVTWTSEADNFNIDVNGDITAVTGNTYTFDVSLLTTYTIKVQADCGDDQSFWTKAISFISGCGIFPVTYSYGFEDANDMNCWTIITTGYYGEYTGIYEDEDDEDYAHTGSHSFRFYYTTVPGQYLISPKLGGFENGLHVEFWYREYSEGYPETFQVGYSTTDNYTDSFTWGTEITATTSYRRFKANYPADTKYVAVKHTSDDQYYLYLDDFLFEESPSCLEPTGVQVADATTHGAIVSWTAGGLETEWDIFVTADATIVPDGTTTPTVANTNNNPYNLTGLSAGTVYYVYVRAICSGTDVSEWSLPATFATECEAMALPYEENFNAGLPVCWSTIFNPSNTNIVTQSKTSPTDPDKILIFQRHYDQNYAFAVLPEIDARYSLSDYQISFDACYYDFETNVKLSIGVMTDPADSTTFVPIDEVDIIDSYDYSDSGFGTYTVYFNNYTCNGRYIAIRDNNINSYGYVLIDNIVVSELPSCLSPTGLTANAASTSAELSWTANNGESSWTLYWKESGAEAYTEVPDLTENSYTLNDLSAGAAYQFCVVAHCDENDHSAPSAVYTFTTNCGPITLPWSEDFDNLAAGEGVPVCWNSIIEGSGSCSIESVSGGNNVLDIFVGQSSGFSNAAVVLPKIDANYPLNQCQISFDACHWSDNGSTTPRQLLIFVLNDPTDLQSGVGFFVDSIVDITNAYPTFGSYTVQFDRYEGTGQYIALVCGGNESSDPYDVLIDNIVVSEATDCNPITLPWNEDFDDLAAGEGVPACWNSIIDGSGSCSIAPLSEDNDNNVLDIHIGQSSGFSNAAVVLPKIDANYPLNQCQISFDASYYSESTTPRQLAIFVLNDPTDLQSGVGFFVDSIVDITDGYPTFGNYTVQFNNYEGTGQYIALVCGGNESSGPYDVLIDNIVLSEASSCLYPTGLAANAASTSAELSWTANNSETSWTLYWKEVGADEYTEVPNVTDNPYTLSNLSAATTYEFYVVAHCDENDHSAPSALYTFTTTDCNPITLPWSEDFDDLAEGEGVPACWETIIDGSGSCSIAPFSGDDNNGLVISINGSSLQNSVTVVLPEVAASYPLNQFQISFDASYWSSNESTTEELLFVLPTNLTTIASDEDIIPVAITDAYPNIGRHTVRFNDYEGNGQYITLVCTGGGSFGGSDSYAVFIDNIEVSPLPSCMPPAKLIASNITGSSAQLAWTANGQSAWDIYVTNDATDVPDDDTIPTVANTEDNPYSLTDLNSLTTYYVYVRTICGENEVSEWSSRATFTTKCATTTVDADNPYTQDFNDETFPPDCWELGGDPISNWYQTVQGYAYTEYNPTYLYMPFLRIDANNAVLTFKTEESRIEFYTGGSEGYDGLSIVKVSTDGGGTWTQLWCPTYDELTTDFRTVTLSLYDYVGQDILIAFEHQGRHGWTIDDVEVKVAPLATFTKTIIGVGEENWNGEKGGYYLIASPLAFAVDPATAGGMITADEGEGENVVLTYDLYSFDQDPSDASGLEWRNYRTGDFNLVNGQGYLYASKNGTTLTFTGTPYSDNTKNVTLHKTDNSSVDFQGWNLVGNPFGVDAHLSCAFYSMQNADILTPNTEGGSIGVMEGVFVVAESDGDQLIFTPAQSGSKIAQLNVNLTKGASTGSATLLDRSIVRFDEGCQLPKLQFRKGSTQVYIPLEGKDYAVVRSEAMGTMPLNFKAENNGTYTLSFTAEEVSFSYFHLIDNMTGNDIDLLAGASTLRGTSGATGSATYTFTAKTTDYESRFKLVFAVGSSTSSDTFAFFSNGSWIINNPSTGSGISEATLQVIDVNGRILSSEQINGSVSKAIHVAPGVYMIRLINGNDVRTQKMVIR